MSKILVVGASGTVGTELVRILKDRGHEVRRATSKAQLEKDQVHLDLVTGEGLTEALQDVERLFLLSPPGHTRQDQLLIPVIREAKKRGVKKSVLMTAMGANADEKSPMRQAELFLESSGLAWNVIRPNWFMQNFNTFWLQGILTQGKILLPTGLAKGSFIDARDIAAVAAALIEGSRFEGQAFDLTGPRALDHHEVAEILSREAGRVIRYQEITPAEMLDGLLQAGLPRDYAEFLNTILAFFKAGYSERITESVELITGKKPRDIEQYARDYQKSWRET